MENKNCNNQSLNSHMLFFDPINRKVTPMPNVIPKKGEAPKAPECTADLTVTANVDKD